MDRLSKMDKEEFVKRMQAQFEQAMREVTDAVNDAADGHLIDGSEERCRDVLGEFRRIAYQTAVQMRVEATEASPDFSPGAARAGASRCGGANGGDVQRTGATASGAIRKGGPKRRHAGG